MILINVENTNTTSIFSIDVVVDRFTNFDTLSTSIVGKTDVEM